MEVESLSNQVLESVRRALLPSRRSQTLRNLLTWNLKSLFADLFSHHLVSINQDSRLELSSFPFG